MAAGNVPVSGTGPGQYARTKGTQPAVGEVEERSTNRGLYTGMFYMREDSHHCSSSVAACTA